MDTAGTSVGPGVQVGGQGYCGESSCVLWGCLNQALRDVILRLPQAGTARLLAKMGRGLTSRKQPQVRELFKIKKKNKTASHALPLTGLHLSLQTQLALS